jgi:hypothetical protein
VDFSVAEQSPEAALPLALRHHFHEYSPERLRVVADSQYDEVTPWVASARAGTWHNRCRM